MKILGCETKMRGCAYTLCPTSHTENIIHLEHDKALIEAVAQNFVGKYAVKKFMLIGIIMCAKSRGDIAMRDYRDNTDFRSMINGSSVIWIAGAFSSSLRRLRSCSTSVAAICSKSWATAVKPTRLTHFVLS